MNFYKGWFITYCTLTLFLLVNNYEKISYLAVDDKDALISLQVNSTGTIYIYVLYL